MLEQVQAQVQSAANVLGINNLPVEGVRMISAVLVGVVGFGEDPMTALKEGGMMELITMAVQFVATELSLGTALGPAVDALPAVAYAYLKGMGNVPLLGGSNRSFMANFFFAIGTRYVGDMAAAGTSSFTGGSDTSPNLYAPYGARTG